MFTERRLVRDRTGCQNVAIDLRFTLQLRGKLDVRSPRTMPRDLSRIKHYYKKTKILVGGFQNSKIKIREMVEDVTTRPAAYMRISAHFLSYGSITKWKTHRRQRMPLSILQIHIFSCSCPFLVYQDTDMMKLEIYFYLPKHRHSIWWSPFSLGEN